jgi:pimeloyl-ACP methyl ester carboxylesterase
MTATTRTFVLIHGGGDVGWYWHRVEAELRARGHDVVAPDLPGDDESQTLTDYADAVVEEAMSKERAHPSSTATSAPWPLDAWPDVPTRFVLSTEDRTFPPGLFRRLVPDRLGIVPDEIAGGHCVALSRPKDVADVLEGYATGMRQRRTGS